MVDNLQTVNIFSPSIPDIVINVLVSTVCGFIVSLVYRFTYRGPGYSSSFVNSMIFLSVITSLVIMVIGNNLARAFGLVGALSIIRFRTAIKDTSDIVYIFLSLTIGMASGVGYHKLALVGTVLASIILLIFSKDRISSFMSNQYMLQFVFSSGNPGNNSFHNVLGKYCRRYEVINIRTSEVGKSMEYSYNIYMLKNKKIDQLMLELENLNGMLSINLFFDQMNS